MANTFLGLDTPNIAAGWGPAPKLDAPSIGALVGNILENRRWQQANTQKNIADTIKNIQQQREDAAFAQQLQAVGLSPGADLSGLGSAHSLAIAKLIQDKREADARAAHLAALTAHVGSARGGGGGGGSGGGSGSAEPNTVWKDGIEWRPGPGGRWIPMKPAGGTKAGEKPTDISKAVKEQLGLQEKFGILEEDRKKQEAADIKAKQANVPFAQSDLYNTTRNRIEQLKAIPGMPSTAAPGASPTPPPADSAAGHADDYGVKGVKMQAPDGTVSTVDPDKVEYFKSKGAVVVP